MSRVQPKWVSMLMTIVNSKSIKWKWGDKVKYLIRYSPITMVTQENSGNDYYNQL